MGKEGLAAFHYLHKAFPGAEIAAIVDDITEPTPDIAALVAGGKAVKLFLGKEATKVLDAFDVVVRSPGISVYRPEVVFAKKKGVVFTSGTDIWFSEHSNERTVCVTGTKGKSTTSALIAHLLKCLGQRVVLGGNAGFPLLGMEEDGPRPDVWVIEASSYQASDFSGSPTASVLLNLFPEHLDWHGSEERYYEDKLNLLRSTRKGKIVLNRTDKKTAELTHDPFFSKAVFFNDPKGFHVEDGYILDGKDRLIGSEEISLRGAHNLSNICAALTAVRSLGFDPKKCVSSIAAFKGLKHRLSVLGEKSGLTFVDDSISTTPQSAMAAVLAFPGYDVTILLGGFDRGLDYNGLARFLVGKPVRVITMAQSGPRIAGVLRAALAKGAKHALVELREAEDLAQAVDIAKKITPAKGLVLLSPAAPSYGRFKNFEERGDAFATMSGL